MNSNYNDILKACQQCIIDCRICLSEMAGKASKNDCPKCCIQCIDACDVLIKMITSDSPYIKQYALLCAEICKYCADHCGEHNHDHCNKCAESCKTCAERCEQIAA